MSGCVDKPSMTVKRRDSMIGKRPTLRAPLLPSNMSKGGRNEPPKGERPPAPAPQPKSNVQEKMKEFMKNKRRAGLDAIIGSIEDVFEENERLKQQLRDYSKDAEIQKLKEEIYDMRLHSISIMSELEKDRADVFASHHAVSCKSGVQYIVYGTGIGTHTTVKCRKCQEEQDITDYEGW
ncbi:hypothetical protein X915_gp159 [Bacillus phage vB_BanS-Tsamsa]|uniref:Uncharacterized protein n=1 Tax=Bacillus phage vB_BanS-Tsamsa TaxID=1308863 RepID=U5JA53_9CAUD|nr:hypothetical protein X915_gp159 [Bacillus phage vB_BanS-Tsamsa]AGI11804.1 hypothetical protein [Bacillus phage vB_BanS-Tsamsa]